VSICTEKWDIIDVDISEPLELARIALMGFSERLAAPAILLFGNCVEQAAAAIFR
jgi:hypothetical protein